MAHVLRFSAFGPPQAGRIRKGHGYMDRSAYGQVSYAVARQLATRSLTDPLVHVEPGVTAALLDQIDELAQEREAAIGRAELAEHTVTDLRRRVDANAAHQLEALRLRSQADTPRYVPLHRHELATVELPLQRSASPALLEINAPAGWFR